MAVPKTPFEFTLDTVRRSVVPRMDFYSDSINTSIMTINLTEDHEPVNLENTTVEIIYDKQDKTQVINTNIEAVPYVEIIDFINGIVKITLTTQALSCEGRVKAQIKVWDGENVSIFPEFTFNAKKGLDDTDATVSSNEFPLLQDLVNGYATAQRGLAYYDWTYTASSDNITSFAITSSDFNPVKDQVDLYDRNGLLYPGINYTRNNSVVTLIDYVLNTGNFIFCRIIKDVIKVQPKADGSMLEDNSVGIVKLTQDVQNDLNSVGDRSYNGITENTLSEAIKNDRVQINNLSTNKTNKTDIADNLTTDDSTKMLSAKQGKTLNDNKANQTDFTAHTQSKGTTTNIGHVKPDNTTITVDDNGTLSAIGTPVGGVATNWSTTATYAANDIITYGGKFWRSRVSGNINNIPSSASTWWAEIYPNKTAFASKSFWFEGNTLKCDNGQIFCMSSYVSAINKYFNAQSITIDVNSIAYFDVSENSPLVLHVMTNWSGQTRDIVSNPNLVFVAVTGSDLTKYKWLFYPKNMEEIATNIQNNLLGYEQMTYTVQSGYYYAVATGTLTASASYQCLKVACIPGDKMRCTTTVNGSATAMAIFYDSTGNTKISTLNQGTDGVNTQYTNYEFTVPANAYYVAITGRAIYPIELDKQQIIHAVTRIEAIEETVNSNQISSYWKDKDIVWFGTSIPCGTTTNNYPAIVASLLGANVTNEAVGYSMTRRGIKALEGVNDPYGWTGMAWQNVAYSFSQTLAEKRYLIDNWSTWKTKLTNSPPSTLDTTTQNFILSCSYENKLIANHLGANRKDLYVFDHGHNDNATLSNGDITTMPSNTRDRGYFLGAMNYLIDLILNDNPKARIIFISEYENQQHPLTVQAQQALSDYWEFDMCRLDKKLGWSQQTVTTTGYWINGVWTPNYGTAHTLTIKQIWLADDTHPHSDLSGSANQIIAQNIAKFLEGVR